MNQRASNGGTNETLKNESGGAASTEDPRHSHVRELTPRSRAEIEIDEESTDSDDSGFFSQNTLIRMGDTFPALKTVARFLTLESYRSLPKPDKLPDLTDLPDVDGADDAPLPGETVGHAPPNAHALLDWDEMEIEDNPKTPYQLYLFDLRVEGYLAQTRAQLGPSLLKKS